MKRLPVVVVLVLMVGCAATKVEPVIARVEPGDQVVADRLVVNLDGQWNRFNRKTEVPIWTVDGFAVDRLQFFVGIKDGEPIAKRPQGEKKQRPLTFRASMKAHEIVALFEGMYTQDGSTFTLDRIEPVTFIGEPGFKFSYTLACRCDDVRRSGVGYGAVHNGELTVINYSAPHLGFFPRYQAQIEKMALGARLKS